jgi:hypothetical protein
MFVYGHQSNQKFKLSRFYLAVFQKHPKYKFMIDALKINESPFVTVKKD